jgi:hypothetical protein
MLSKFPRRHLLLLLVLGFLGSPFITVAAQASDEVVTRAANEKFALIRVCVKYLWRCEGYANPLPKRPSNPLARCTRFCAQERIYN